MAAGHRATAHGRARSKVRRTAAAGARACCRCCRRNSVTEHSVELPSGKLAYTATAGTLSLFDQSGESSAAIFYTAYVAKADESANRPLTFVFNGGPGAGSAYLNLGSGRASHRRVRSGSTATATRCPPAGQSGHLARLHRSRADRSDRRGLEPAGQARRRQGLLGRRSDASAMAKAIALYVAKNGRARHRQNIILGESYGGFRAAKVARRCKQRAGHRRLRHRHGVAADRGRASHSAAAASRSAQHCNCPRSRRPSSSAKARSARRRWRRPNASRSPTI